MKYSEKDWEFINRELGEWGGSVVEALEEKIRKKKLVFSAELMRSLHFEVLKGSAERAAQLKLIFQDVGRIKDIKTLNYKKMSPIKEMEDFVRKKGVENFKYVPGYERARNVPTENRAVNRIAWGIALSRLRKNKRRPVKWFSKTFYGMINVLIDQLLEGYQKQATDSIVQSFND